MCYPPFFLHLLLLICTVEVNSQSETLRCFTQDNCGGMSTTLRSDPPPDPGKCCNFPRNGSRALGYSYQFVGLETCTSCPKVFGFFNTTFTADESPSAIELPFGYYSGAPPGEFLSVIITASGISADSSDYDLSSTQGRFFFFPGIYIRDVEVQHNPDGIAQESPEQYKLQVSQFQSDFPGFSFVDATGTIIDTDVVEFFFKEADYCVNEGTVPPVIVAPLAKDSRITLANPVVFRVLPITIQEAQDRGYPLPGGVLEAIASSNSFSPIEAISADFNTTVFNVTYPAAEGVNSSIDSVRVNVVDDDINEATEQFFLIEVEVVEAVNPSMIFFSRNVTIGIIVDNDPIRIGFSQPTWTFEEPQSLQLVSLLLVKENNQSTEQTFEVRLTIVPPTSIIEATIGEDYVPAFSGTSVILRFLPSASSVAVIIWLIPDNFAEGNEGFRVTSESEGKPRYAQPTQTSSVFRSAEVIIYDDDDPVAVIRSSKPMPILLGDYLNLTCSINNSSDTINPPIVWLHNEVILENVTSISYTISGVQLKHLGVYKCGTLHNYVNSKSFQVYFNGIFEQGSLEISSYPSCKSSETRSKLLRGVFQMLVRDHGAKPFGRLRIYPAASCLQVHLANPTLESGEYWIAKNEEDPEKIFCHF